MSFIGIIAANKEFECIKNLIYKVERNNINIIKITEKNIENIKNIKFDTILICKEISNFKINEEVLKQIIRCAKYLVINTDISIENSFFCDISIKIITYGLNQKATITVSSIGEENIMICLQRNILNLKNNIIEPYEVNIKIEKINNKKIYNYLASYTILTLYEAKIQ